MKKWIIAVIALMLLSMTAAVLYVQTAAFRDWLKTTMLQAAEPHINGQLSINSLEGNLWSKIELNGIRWDYEAEPVVQIGQIRIEYDPWMLILRKTAVFQATVETPQVIVRKEGETWNVSELIVTDTSGTVNTVKSEDVSASKSWQAEGRFVIKDGAAGLIGLESPQVLFPERIEQIETDLTVTYADEQLSASIAALHFISDRPAWRIRRGSGQISSVADSLALSEIALTTDESNFRIKRAVFRQGAPEFEIDLAADSLSFDAFRTIMPDLPIYGKATVEASVSVSGETVAGALSLGHKAGRLTLNSRLEMSQTPPAYNIEGRITRFNPAVLLRDRRYEAQATLGFNARGAGYTPAEMDVKAAVQIDRLAVGDYILLKSSVRTALKNNRLQINGMLTSPIGATDVSGMVSIDKNNPIYHVEGVLRQVDLTRFIGEAGPLSLLNGRYRIDGRGFDQNAMRTRLDLDLGPLRFRDVYLDTLHAAGAVHQDTLLLDEALIAAPAGTFAGRGHWVIGDTGFVELTAEIPDMKVFSISAPADTSTLEGAGSLAAALHGRLDSLHVVSNVRLSQLAYQQYRMDEVHAAVTGRLLDREPTFNLAADIRGAALATLDSLDARLDMAYEDSLSIFRISANRGQTALSAAGSLAVAEDGYALALHEADIDFRGRRWEKTPVSTLLRYSGSDLRMTPLTIHDQEQTVTVSGEIDTAGAGRIDLSYTAVDIPGALALADKPDTSVAGVISGALSLENPLRAPRATGWFEVIRGRYGQQTVDRLYADYSVVDRRLSWQLQAAVPGLDSLITSTGYLPFAPPDSSHNIWDGDAPLDMTIRLPGINLARAQGLIAGVTEIQGRLQADIRLYNTLNDLRGGGRVQISDAAWRVPDLGIRYQNARLKVALRDTAAIIEDLHVAARRGQVSVVSGGVSLSRQRLDRMGAQLSIRRFPLMYNRKMRAVVDGTLALSGTVGGLDLQGHLRVPEANIYYPAWLEGGAVTALTERPFFVIDTDTVFSEPQGAVRFQKKPLASESSFDNARIYRDLRGSVTLQFARNTWIRSDEAAIEIEGELQILKEKGRDLVLFGTLSTVRGYYELQGNRFHIVEGQLNFSGDPIINPLVHIDAVHEYFDSDDERRIKHQLRILITGTSAEPQMSFKIDDRDAAEQDVISILLFGKPFETLTIGQQSRITAESGSQNPLARFLSGAVLKRMTRQLERQLRLDLLQVDRGQGMTVQAGKYLASGVFVSVSQGFEGQENQRVELEYKLPVLINLFLRALREKNGNNSVDVIWKTEW